MNIEIPQYVILIPYGLLLLGVAFFTLVNIVNLVRYGARNWIGLTATFVYLSGAAIILFFTWDALKAVEWASTIPLGTFNTAPF